MSAVIESAYPAIHEAPVLGASPMLLEYRSEADPEAEFIPKTIAGFCFGAMVFGFCLNLGQTLFTLGSKPAIVNTMAVRGCFMLGITGVAASLLLVGLKVRADNCKEALYSRHWINSITTGAIYALMIWGPWILIELGMFGRINRFVAAAVLMGVMAFPAVAAKWTIGPAPKHVYGV
jgi:hypothetical protein